MTKEYKLTGYFNNKLVLVTTSKANSPKQAQQRFINKFGAVLVGNWSIKITLAGKQVHSFKCTNQLELI